MTAAAHETWQEDNRLYLASVLDELHLRLGHPETDQAQADLRVTANDLQATMTEPPSLVRLAGVFGLDAFELDVVAWCAGFELDARYRSGGPPTVGQALARLRDPSWGALHRAAPLRQWGLVEVDEQVAFGEATIRLGRDVLVFLLGLPVGTDPGDPAVSDPGSPAAAPSQEALARSIVAALHAVEGRDRKGTVIALHGATLAERRLVVQLCARLLAAGVVRMDGRDVLAEDLGFIRTVSDWKRLAGLTGGLPLLEFGEQSAGDGESGPMAADSLRRASALVGGPLFVSSPSPTVIDPLRTLVRRVVELPAAPERLLLWQTGLGSMAGASMDVEPWLSQVAFQYRFDTASIASICAEAVGLGGDDPSAISEEVQAGCRRLSRTHLDAVADRVIDDGEVGVVLPSHQGEQLEELESHIRLSYQVTTVWGLGGSRARGVAALFAGPSGTGKTLAASVIARNVGLDLYRVDLATVLSKYIGETEKNLQRIFDAAEVGGAILLFDEADALFGKRSEVKDSHDRYANIGTAYLLQKVEQAVTPTVLTTNIKDAIDPAFARRLRFVVDFPFPDEHAREEIWRSVYPGATPTNGLDPAKLASLAVNGATIRKIALRAAFVAADRDEPVMMEHLMDCSRRELRQSGRPVRPEEVAGWLER